MIMVDCIDSGIGYGGLRRVIDFQAVCGIGYCGDAAWDFPWYMTGYRISGLCQGYPGQPGKHVCLGEDTGRLYG